MSREPARTGRPRPAEAPAPAPNQRQRQAAARREAIITAATARFARLGYERTRIADVARDAGITDAGLLHHFSSKRALFFAVVEGRDRPYERHLAGDGPPATVRELFDRFVDAVGAAASDATMVRFRVILSGAALLEDHPMEGRARRYLERGLDALVPALRRGIAAGELRVDVDAEQIALEVLALNEGTREQSVTMPERVDYARVFARALDRLYAGIAAPGA